MPKRQFVSVETRGVKQSRLEFDDEIVLSLNGPRGGTIAAEAISLESAEKLYNDLGNAIRGLKGLAHSDSRWKGV